MHVHFLSHFLDEQFEHDQDQGLFVEWRKQGSCQGTAGSWKIGDDVITKDSLFVIIVEIDTRIYKTYP